MMLSGRAWLQTVHSGEKSCVEMVEASLAKIAEHNKLINACIEIADIEALLEKARAVDAKVANGEALRPLEGLPFLIKANIDTAGMLTTAATHALKDHRPNKNSLVWQRLEDAGALLLGKTNMSELAGAACGYSPLHGHVRNPHAHDFSSSGSSSGTAAGIAAGFAPVGLGTDTTGSCRAPASACGICGMRPSLGRHSLEGIVPLDRMDTVGPMAATVGDLALIGPIMAGEAASADPLTPADLTGIKILVPTKWGMMQESPTGADQEALNLAIEALKKANAVIVSDDSGLFEKLDEKIQGAKLANLFSEEAPSTSRRDMSKYLTKSGSNVTVDDIVDQMHETSFMLKYAFTSPQGQELCDLDDAAYEERLKPFRNEAMEMTQSIKDYFTSSGISAILVPVGCRPPPNCYSGDLSYATLESEILQASKAGDRDALHKASRKLRRLIGFSTTLFNWLDFPVPSIVLRTPATHKCEGDVKIPTGVMLYGLPNSDRELLALAWALERSIDSL